jgi:hypothetical protein
LFGYIGIEPRSDLAETAAVLAEALGGLTFTPAEGQFDEFPAFVAQARAVRYALLGNPDRENDIREHPTTDFELRIEATQAASEIQPDLTDQVLAMLEKDGRLTCWILK